MTKPANGTDVYRKAVEIVRADWYAKHNRHAGAMKWMAEQLGITKQSLDIFRKKGGFPTKYMASVCRITGLTEEQLSTPSLPIDFPSEIMQEIIVTAKKRRRTIPKMVIELVKSGLEHQ